MKIPTTYTKEDRVKFEDFQIKSIFSKILFSEDDEQTIQSYIFDTMSNKELVQKLKEKKYGEWGFDDLEDFDKYVIKATQGVRGQLEELQGLIKSVKLIREEAI